MHDQDKRIHYQAHRTTEPRDLYFHFDDAVGNSNPSKLLNESYDFENDRMSNASEYQKGRIEELYQKFISENEKDLTTEWSGEFASPTILDCFSELE